MPKISILVPVYNVEAYLQRCIDSVLAQDFQDWEMILVDDGSPDRCPQICDEAAAKDRRISVVHKENGGLVSARKAGWLKARADYVMHLDSDDYLLPGALTALYSKAIEGDYDIVKGCNQRVLDDGSCSIERPKRLNEDVVGEENYLRALLSYEILPYLWGGLYRRSLFSEDIFSYVLDISIGEDWITNQAIYKGVRRYATIGDVVCAYYINTASMMQQRVLTHEYHERFGDKMRHIASNATQDIHHIIERDRMINHIRCFFMPEIGWSNEWYARIRQYIDADNNNLRELKQHSDGKFLRFIGNRYLFRVYAASYRFLYATLKLHGKRRNII